MPKNPWETNKKFTFVVQTSYPRELFYVHSNKLEDVQKVYDERIIKWLESRYWLHSFKWSFAIYEHKGKSAEPKVEFGWWSTDPRQLSYTNARRLKFASHRSVSWKTLVANYNLAKVEQMQAKIPKIKKDLLAEAFGG